MAEDNFPFDRPHWTVSVSFPLEHLARQKEIEARVSELAESRGGTISMSSQPTAEFAGREGYRTFGFAVVFEAGDANADGFIRLVQGALAAYGVSVEHDPEDVTYPAEEDLRPGR